MSAIGKCPWPGCGGEGRAPDILGFFAVQCQKCGATGPILPREEEAITAWNRLATPDPERVTGRVRKEDNGDRYFLGPLYCGQVAKVGGEWMVIALGQHTSTHPTEATARSALVAAVKEAIGDE